MGLQMLNVQLALFVQKESCVVYGFDVKTGTMILKHVDTIRALVETLVKSENFHALVVQSAPGWGKSSTVERALQMAGIQPVLVGSYATALHIYNLLGQTPEGTFVLDDSAGLFSDIKTMAILKAATWQSGDYLDHACGENHQSERPMPVKKSRRINWGSSSGKVDQPFIDFTGKIIILTNTLPAGRETEAFLSRCLSYRMIFSPEQIKEALFVAAQAVQYFQDVKRAGEVVEFLIHGSARADLTKINLRTLRLGYDLAGTHQDSWRDLFLHLLPRSEEPKDQIAEILQSDLSIKEQEAKFLATTGKSRRSFYNYRRKLGLTREYQVRARSK